MKWYNGAKTSGISVPHLSRYDLRPLLRPLHGMTISLEQDGSVTGNIHADQSALSIETGALARGWYMVEALVDSSHSYLDANFLLQHKGGRRPRRLRLPLRNGRMSKRLIWLARGGEKLQFSPAQTTGEFRIRQLTFVRVSALFARSRMRLRLQNLLLTVPRKTSDRWVRYDATFSPNRARASYGDWIKKIEPKLWPKSRIISVKANFSLLMPIGAGDALSAIQESVASVQAQCCEAWELTMLTVDSLDTGVLGKLRQLADTDNRIRIAHSVAGGFYVSSQGDQDAYHLIYPPRAALAPMALTCMSYAVHRQPQAKVIYADEDHINEAGRRHCPQFKSAWNLDLLYSQNYIGEFVLFAPGVLAAFVGVSFDTELAWDSALLLQVLHNLDDPQREVIHIPRILFHRYKMRNEEEYLQSCQRALLHHFSEIGHADVKVDCDIEKGTLRTSWPLPPNEPLVSLLIPTRDMLPVLRQCVESILQKTTYRNYEILILDNQSVEVETLEYLANLESLPNVRVIRYDAPFNYSAINNFGAEHARGEIIGLVNNDIEVISPGWLTEMVGHAIRPQIGCVGAKLYYGDGRIQHAGVVVGLGGLAGHAHKFYTREAPGYMNRLMCTQNFSAVTAACLLLRKSIYEEVGGLNEKHLAVAFNDVDLCLKVRKAGYRNLWTPWAEMYHHESVSRGIDNTPEKRARFAREAKYLKKRWSTLAGKDPYYSPFLTHTREDFSLGLNEKIEAPVCR